MVLGPQKFYGKQLKFQDYMALGPQNFYGNELKFLWKRVKISRLYGSWPTEFLRERVKIFMEKS